MLTATAPFTNALAVGVSVSGSYSVLVNNVTIEQCKTACEFVIGDYGFIHSGLPSQLIGSVLFENVTCLKSTQLGVFVQNYATVAASEHAAAVKFENCTLFGSFGGGEPGVYLDKAHNTTFDHCIITGFDTGIVTPSTVTNGLFNNCVFTDNTNGVGTPIAGVTVQ